mmetsp:Transcript_41996/g.88212  ORF Transcript_41996/g.88212 Transcript_41996/m.88212 type:complete len:264 (+) Transcript_41996:465-1256(+)
MAMPAMAFRLHLLLINGVIIKAILRMVVNMIIIDIHSSSSSIPALIVSSNVLTEARNQAAGTTAMRLLRSIIKIGTSTMMAMQPTTTDRIITTTNCIPLFRLIISTTITHTITSLRSNSNNILHTLRLHTIRTRFVRGRLLRSITIILHTSRRQIIMLITELILLRTRLTQSIIILMDILLILLQQQEEEDIMSLHRRWLARNAHSSRLPIITITTISRIMITVAMLHLKEQITGIIRLILRTTELHINCVHPWICQRRSGAG